MDPTKFKDAKKMLLEDAYKNLWMMLEDYQRKSNA
jgi:hypothetical protein